MKNTRSSVGHSKLQPFIVQLQWSVSPAGPAKPRPGQLGPAGGYFIVAFKYWVFFFEGGHELHFGDKFRTMYGIELNAFPGNAAGEQTPIDFRVWQKMHQNLIFKRKKCSVRRTNRSQH